MGGMSLRHAPLLPAALFYAAFLVAPGAGLLVLSLHPFDPVQLAGPGWTLANYAAALADRFYLGLLAGTVLLGAAVTAVTLLLGYPLAYVLARSPSRLMRRTVLFGLVLTFLSGGVTHAYAWLILLGNKGLINQGLAALGLSPVKLAYNETGVVIGVVHFLLPFFTLTLLSALKNIDRKSVV